MLTLPGPARAREGDGVDAKAIEGMKNPSDFLARTRQFSVMMDVAYDIVQEWGQKLEFGESRKLTLRRPDRFKVETTDRDGAVSGVVFDGREIAAFNVADKVYATTPQPGSIDDAMAHIVDDLGMALPMAAIFEGRVAKDGRRGRVTCATSTRRRSPGSPAITSRSTATGSSRVWSVSLPPAQGNCEHRHDYPRPDANEHTHHRSAPWTIAM